jgi:mRNA interferase MazF
MKVKNKSRYNLLINIKRGDIYYYDFGAKNGSIQGDTRPAVIIQNDIGNKYSPTTIVAVITTKNKTPLPTHVDLFYSYIKTSDSKLNYSTILFEQIFTVNKKDLRQKIGEIDLGAREFNEALKISLGLW